MFVDHWEDFEVRGDRPIVNIQYLLSAVDGIHVMLLNTWNEPVEELQWLHAKLPPNTGIRIFRSFDESVFVRVKYKCNHINNGITRNRTADYDDGWQAGYDAGFMAADSYIQFEGEGI